MIRRERSSLEALRDSAYLYLKKKREAEAQKNRERQSRSVDVA